MSLLIKCSDGITVEVPYDAKLGETLENLKTDTEDDSCVITIDTISSTVFNVIIDFSSKNLKPPELTQIWDTTEPYLFFEDLDFKIIIDMTSAADFLQYEDLLDCCVRYHAETIKNKTVDEIRELYL
jgi:hypothetical protein